MRSSFIAILLLAAVFQSHATSSVSGFAVSAKVNSYDFMWGGYGPVMRFDIANGVTTQTTVLFSGNGHSPR
jgi:hypothetical protein